MAKNDEPFEDQTMEVASEEQAADNMSTLQKIKQQAKESDEAPSGSLKLSDILGGEFLLSFVRRQAWLIILVVLITTAYVAVRYQCQQDAIDISQLEKDLVNAKFEALSSSSNLTRMSRQSNITDLLEKNDSVKLHSANQPPFIIDVPAENNK